ncbi:MAG: hypothetical protein ACI9JN_000616 [Bacteroidia bacterium]|jgi:hypothetical protein
MTIIKERFFTSQLRHNVQGQVNEFTTSIHLVIRDLHFFDRVILRDPLRRKSECMRFIGQ